jgi:hypothetical protein
LRTSAALFTLCSTATSSSPARVVVGADGAGDAWETGAVDGGAASIDSGCISVEDDGMNDAGGMRSSSEDRGFCMVAGTAGAGVAAG